MSSSTRLIVGGIALIALAGGAYAMLSQPSGGTDGPESKAEVAERRAQDLAARGEGRGKAKAKAKAGEINEARPKGQPGVQNVIFVVMDTVRSQSLSMCGYDRPTSPFLESLRDRTGAAATCDAYSAGTWTIPSHTSYFTGKPVSEHGMTSMGKDFAEDTPVLSELMAQQGYQTVMVSANPTLSKTSGLQRGFQYVRTGKGLVELRGKKMVDATERQLKQVDPRKPLFLFLNLIDAHDPYPRIPGNVDWLPARPSLDFDVHQKDLNAPYHQFIRGEMSDEEEEALIAATVDGYDWGVSRADATLQGLVGMLRANGWLKSGFRLIVTSDHGEFLGEHNLLRHGCYTWEPVVKVPFLYYDSDAEEQVTLPSPMSATSSYQLALTGKLPEPALDVTAFSKRRKLDVKKGADMAALWTSRDDKLLWKEGALLRVDLANDPDELDIKELGDHPRREDILRYGEQHEASIVQDARRKDNASRRAELEALGYIE